MGGLKKYRRIRKIWDTVSSSMGFAPNERRRLRLTGRHAAILCAVLVIIPILLSLSPVSARSARTVRYVTGESGELVEVPDGLIIIGHRGCLREVENTIPAVLGALEAGAELIEVDVTLSADGVPMIYHDIVLTRLAAEDTYIYELDSQTLQQKVLTQDGKEGRMPTLDALFKSMPAHGVLLLDLKQYGPDIGGFVDAVMDVVRENGMEKRCILQTAGEQMLMTIRQNYPEATAGFVKDHRMGALAASIVERIPADFFSVYGPAVSEALVEACHSAGKPLYVWTINKVADVPEYLRLGVDGIITDYPGEVRTFVYS